MSRRLRDRLRALEAMQTALEAVLRAFQASGDNCAETVVLTLSDLRNQQRRAKKMLSFLEWI